MSGAVESCEFAGQHFGSDKPGGRGNRPLCQPSSGHQHPVGLSGIRRGWRHQAQRGRFRGATLCRALAGVAPACGRSFAFWHLESGGTFPRTDSESSTVLPHETAWLQVRAWQRSTGASYEEARALGHKFGRSDAFSLITADEMEPPPDLAGLSSFHLQAGLPEFNVGRIEFVEQSAGLGVWSLQGAAGFQYVVEKSVGDFVWRPLMVLTNATGTATFSEPISSTNVFYRARILD